MANDKPTFQIIMLGQKGQGKTTLTTAVLATQAKKGLAKASTFQEPNRNGSFYGYMRYVTVIGGQFNFDSERFRYVLLDPCDHIDIVKALVAGSGRSAVDIAILVIDPRQGLTREAKDQLSIAQRIGARGVVVFLNEFELLCDDELIQIAEAEIHEFLRDVGLRLVVVVKGSANTAYGIPSDQYLSGDVCDLLLAIDGFVSQLGLRVEPLLIEVIDTYSRDCKHIEVGCMVQRGIMHTGQEVDVVGLMKERHKAIITKVIRFGKEIAQGIAYDLIRCFLQVVAEVIVERGSVLAAPNSIEPHDHFEAEMYWLSKDEGGVQSPLLISKPQFYFRDLILIFGAMKPISPECVHLGGHCRLVVKLLSTVALELGDRFLIRDDSQRTMGLGIVTKLL